MDAAVNIPGTLPKPFVFVLMPFDAKYDDTYTFGIKGAAEDVGAYAERLDEQIFAEGMLDRIFNQISKADVIVADMTGRSPNVFYEVGYAHALGKIVLLLTQDSADIPFDLKHRQHTVYGGKIELLRRELTSKLQWAIGESRRISEGGLPERISVRISGADLPQGIDLEDVPTIRGRINERSFVLPLLVRNDSVEAAVGISHTYLFAEESTRVIPATTDLGSHASGNWASGFPGTTFLSLAPTITRIEPFSATPVDAPDDLTSQFRLPVSFASIPPGAIEQDSIQLILEEGATECNALFRLRLHTAQRYFDFTFRLKIEYVQEAAASPTSSQGEEPIVLKEPRESE